MRISSSWRDYYDCIQRDDPEKASIFVRKNHKYLSREEIAKYCVSNQYGHKKFPGVYYDKDEYIKYGLVVGFAGKCYPAINTIRNNHTDRKWYLDHIPVKSTGKYSIFNSERMLADYANYWNDPKTGEYWAKAFGPIFTIHFVNGYWSLPDIIIDDRLNQYNFQEVLDPYTAYFSLQRWFYNQALPEKPIPELSNEDKIISAGFHLKASFRNVAPGGPKRKRKN